MSHPDFTLHRLRDQFLAASGGAQEGVVCPPPDDIFAACRGELPADRIETLLDHALDCAHCTEALALAREVVSEMDEPVAATAGRSWTWTRIGLVAALLLVAFVGFTRLLETGDPESVDDFRAGGLEFEVTTPLVAGAELPRDAFVLRWDGATAGSYYTIEVVTADLRPVDRAEDLRDAEYRVADEKLALFEAGTEMLWRIDVATPDGERYESPAFRVVLRD
jgi:hypothetical protein